MTNTPASKEAPTDLAKESAAGEEDPGAAIELQSAGADGASPIINSTTGKGPCGECGGSGRAESGDRCPACDGVGTVTA